MRAAVLIGSLLLALLTTLPARAQDAGAIRQVIEAQLDAFRRDDGARAFGYASPGIQGMFGTPETFMAMVRTGYPQVYRARRTQFEPVATEGGRIVQRVLIEGADGQPVVARYTMEQQADGSWRIAGCTIEESGQVAT